MTAEQGDSTGLAQLDSLPNINTVWGTLLVEELVRCGVEHFVISPGSRSAPLACAIAGQHRARAHLCWDERSAAFMALGIARATRAPAAVLTTSGTAAANLWPAVVEASQDCVPMLLLTADRPPELHECGANQSIRQTGLFGDYARWSCELPCPDDRVSTRVVLTTAAHAVAHATNRAGPVQLNCRFREPLTPAEEEWDRGCLHGTRAWSASTRPFTHIDPPRLAPSRAATERAARCILELGDECGLVVAGGIPGDPQNRAAVELADGLGWPLIADVRSGQRLGNESRLQFAHLDRLLGPPNESNKVGFAPRGVVQIGGRLTSKRLLEQLAAAGLRFHIAVDPFLRRLDPDHTVTEHVQADPAVWTSEVLAAVGSRSAPVFSDDLAAADRAVEAALVRAIDDHEALSEPFVARWLTRHVPPEHGLFLSSSMPIRDVQSYAVTDGPALHVESNRGASGIDGVVATAAGFAAGGTRPVTLLIGDVALLHDVGSLALLGTLDTPVVAVVLNNGGGSIFSWLPIAAHDDLFSPWFDSPHDFRFGGAAEGFGLAYHEVDTREAFEHAYHAAVRAGRAALIEVRTSRDDNIAHHERIEEAIEQALAEWRR